MMERSRITWDGTRSPRNIYEVWDFIGLHIRQEKDRLQESTDTFYGRDDRVNYLCNVNEALKAALDHKKSVNKVTNIQDLEQLLELSPGDSEQPRLLKKAIEVLKPYTGRTKTAMLQLQDVKQSFQKDVLHPLEIYCSTYVKLGIADDHFYRSLRSRTAKIRSILKHFDKLSLSLQRTSAVSGEYFCDSNFSDELAHQFDCDKFTVIRVVPDLIQKLEVVIEIGQDWLRSDKVYVEQIQEEIENARVLLKEKETDLQRVKFEHDRLTVMVKRKQQELDDMDDDRDAILKELSKLEAKKTKAEMETAAVSKALQGCRDQLRDLYSATDGPSSGLDDVDGYDPVRPDTISHSHSSYRLRLRNDARSYNDKLDYLRLKNKYLERKLTRTRKILAELDAAENELQKLSKSLKIWGRRQSKCLAEISSQKALLEVLEQTLNKRLKLVAGDSNDVSREGSAKPRKRTKHRKKIKSKRSEELSKAFRLVKNNIGHNWKDLARTLPYGDEKDLSEIDIEIRAIEYANQGQLKEQAYQSLLKWYNHTGKRASVELLTESLRDIKQNRLADTIEMEVVQKTDHSSETEIKQ